MKVGDESYRFRPMKEADARLVLGWRYEEPYAVYNSDGQDTEDGVKTLLDPRNAYYSVLDGQESLVAFRCFGPDASVPGGDYAGDALDTGGGLRPDLTGRGMGLGVLTAGLEFGRSLFRPRAFRVTVAEFNIRAQHVCHRAGFAHASRFQRESDGAAFVILVREEPGRNRAAGEAS